MINESVYHENCVTYYSLSQAQIKEHHKAVASAPVYGVHPPQSNGRINENTILYPSLNDFMGMEITSEMLSANQVALFPAQSVINYLKNLHSSNVNVTSLKSENNCGSCQ